MRLNACVGGVWSVGLVLTVCAGAALASPRDTLSFAGVNSDGEEDTGGNVVQTANVTGSYGVSKVRVSGTLNAVSAFTYATEAVMRVTPPNGASPFYIQLSGLEDTFTSLSWTDVQVYLPTPVANAQGTWEVRFFELYDDGGIDSNWSSLTITLDDEAPGFQESVDAGGTLATAAVTGGSGPLPSVMGEVLGDEDLFKITICDPASFAATTVRGSFIDTRLFLFDSTGRGVVFNDDHAEGQDYFYQSRITNPGTIVAGEYYLGVAAYQRMAVDSGGQAIWANTPFETVRTPDGPGAANALAGWTGTPFEDGRYVVILTGACYGQTGPVCGDQDFNGDGDFGTDQDIEAFFACLGGNCCATCFAGGSDFNGDGDFGTDQDIESFFRVLAGGTC